MKDKTKLPNPFPGLRSFRSDEDYLFFGREEQTLELMARLQRHRFIAVVGTSGRGKSSLVRCGLLSRLQGGGMVDAGAHWEIAVMHPGGDPFRQLADALFDVGLYDRAAENALPQLLATLRRSHFGLVQAIKQAALAAGTNFLLVVDQFEEIFRYDEAGAEESEAANDFVAALREASAQTEVPIYVVTTMRSDFIGDCSRFEGLAQAVNLGEYLVPGLTREQFKSAIEGPIKVAGGQITPRLLQRLLNDVGEEQDQLPCLQHALMRTWRVWQRRDGAVALDLEDYAQVGKMSQALSVHADEIYFGLASDRQRELCAAMFKALTVEGSEKRGIRRPRRLQTLGGILGVEKAELIPIIDAFRHPEVSFVMPPTDVELRDGTVIDLSHESLMRVWSRLRDWVDEEAKSVGIFRRLSESAALWRQGKTGLYRDPELSIARAWFNATRPNAVWAAQYEGNFDEATAFLQASAGAAEAEANKAVRRQRLLVGGLATAVVALCIAGMVGLQARKREFQRMSRADVATASRALEEGRVADGLAYLLRAAKRDDRNPEIAPRLVSVLTSRKFQLPEASPLELGARIRAVRYSDDDTKVTVFADDGTIAIVDRAARRVSTIKLPVGLTGSYGGVLTRGRLAFVAGRDSVIRVVDGDTGQIVKEFKFGRKLMAAWGVNETDPVVYALLEDGAIVACRNQPGDGMRRLITRDSKTWFNFSEDGRWFYSSADEDHTTLMVWDAVTGQRVGNFTTEFPLAGFLPNRDGTRVLARVRQDNRVLWQMFSLPDGKPLNSPVGFENGVAPLETRFLPDGKRFFVRWPQAVRVYDTGSLRPLGPDIKGELSGAWFSPDGERLLVNADDNAHIYDIASGQATTRALANGGNLQGVTFTPDGRRVMTATVDGYVRVWDAATGDLLGEPTTKVPDVIAALSRDGVNLVLGSATGRVYRMRVSRGAAEPLVLPSNDLPVGFARESAAEFYWIAGDQIRQLDVASGREAAPAITLPATLTAGGIVNVRSDLEGMVVHRGGNRWDSWRIAGNKVDAVPLEPGAPRASVRAVNSKGTRVVLTYNQRLRAWDLATGKAIGPEIQFEAPISSVSFDADGRRAAVGTVIGVVAIADVESGKVLTELKGLRDVQINSVRFDDQGTRVVVANSWGEVQIWDGATGEALSPVINQNGNGTVAGFSRGGERLLTYVMRTASVWNGRTGTPAGATMVHPTRVNSAGFDRVGDRIVTTADNAVRVWDARTGRLVCEPMTVAGVRFTSAYFSPDGRFVRAVGRPASSTTNQHYFWSLPPPAAAGAAIPDWLLDLAAVCGSRTVDADEQFADAPDALGKLESVRRTLSALPASASYAEWGRWFLSDDPERLIAPGFAITRAQARKLRDDFARSAATPTASGTGGQ